MIHIYILQLENDKYYVGKTTNPEFRLDKHFNNYASAWTKKHSPISILEIMSECDEYDEDKYTIKAMAEHGIENVRGGSFVNIKLNDCQIAVILNMIDSSENKCFYCGESDHFIRNCPLRKNTSEVRVICYRCKREGHDYTKCYAKTKADGTFIANPQDYSDNDSNTSESSDSAQ